jgi:hypothetical protein
MRRETLPARSAVAGSATHSKTSLLAVNDEAQPGFGSVAIRSN